MSQLIQRIQIKPNPQGMGCVPILQDWAVLCPQLPELKSAGDVVRDYCLSALVLTAKFRFRPVPGKRYYLYSVEQEWNLTFLSLPRL